MEIAFGLIGGLGLFLYGMTLMGNALQKSAGPRMKDILAALTNKRIVGVIVGAIVTMIIQSSSATTVMTVGFVNAGLMNLSQAIGIIMGANIGTTVTAQLVAFKLTDIAPFVIGIGVAFYLGAKKKRVKEIAEIFIGFGILFLGMSLMKDAIKPLKELEIFKEAMTSFNSPIVGILAGFAITAVLQSSSATTGLLIAVAGSGLMTIEMAYPILFGENIGTCVTAMLASIGANKTAKRAALMHLIFNVIGTIMFLILLRIPVQYLVEYLSPGNIERQIANAHTLFNIISVIIMLPFANWIVKIAEKLIKGDDGEREGDLKYVDERLFATPAVALVQVSKEVLRMAKMVEQQLVDARVAIMNNDEDMVYTVFEKEKNINAVEKQLLEYMVQLSKLSLTSRQRDKIATLMNTINDVERIGDHADNIAELALVKIENKSKFSEMAKDELNDMLELVIDTYKLSILTFKTTESELGMKVFEKEKKINAMEKELRSSHIKRLNEGACITQTGIVFLDTISNLERIGDHATNIAESIIEVINRDHIETDLVEDM
ncbi:phosphate:Na+ symporter [Dethiosulfatibacter aminovorans DSM 17477]|uniref:Phosphate:Na+ symporter n=1 Tax=Dethiosulfatibacter aminovorans DSM 17477 TaxID=1121476 RepID=A0A1M6FCB1_9FIRM|nr:Na/Pi cotransporter family protein [Dethiosulfatibacter aminovorans]SHI95368.1 phosphate:Na+ symporter [Dethiosulfatibacter aminovorans DSM 17477]